MHYPIVIHKDSDSDYGVTVPDLPGCFSAGDTIDDAIAQAAEAIECHIEGLVLDGNAIPTPRNIECHQKNPDYTDGVWALVSVTLVDVLPPLKGGDSHPPPVRE
jgi:predicted RNase H-like HicB family nuclease